MYHCRGYAILFSTKLNADLLIEHHSDIESKIGKAVPVEYICFVCRIAVMGSDHSSKILT